VPGDLGALQRYQKTSIGSVDFCYLFARTSVLLNREPSAAGSRYNSWEVTAMTPILSTLEVPRRIVCVVIWP